MCIEMLLNGRLQSKLYILGCFASGPGSGNTREQIFQASQAKPCNTNPPNKSQYCVEIVIHLFEKKCSHTLNI